MKNKNKRTDSNRTVLRKGEGQRSDNGLYYYRYSENGTRKTIYAATLDELREEEKKIQQCMFQGISYSAGNMTVMELVLKYLPLTGDAVYSTKVNYNFVVNVLKTEPFANRKICTVKISEAKAWLISLHDRGYKRNTICTIRGVVKPAFQMAVEDRIISANPFDFKLKSINIKDDAEKIPALKAHEQETFMNFLKGDKIGSKYYDACLILLETGLRISEFCGLTFKDIDFENGVINVDHKLYKKKGGVYAVDEPKTENAVRQIPMTVEAYNAFKRVIADRNNPKIETIVDGYSGFLFLNYYGQPHTAVDYQHAIKRLREKFAETHSVVLPKITPHVFRHTFCTNMAYAKMNIKSLQYVMGHADIATTLAYYVDVDLDYAVKDMGEVVKLAVNK